MVSRCPVSRCQVSRFQRPRFYFRTHRRRNNLDLSQKNISLSAKLATFTLQNSTHCARSNRIQFFSYNVKGFQYLSTISAGGLVVRVSNTIESFVPLTSDLTQLRLREKFDKFNCHLTRYIKLKSSSRSRPTMSVKHMVLVTRKSLKRT